MRPVRQWFAAMPRSRAGVAAAAAVAVVAAAVSYAAPEGPRGPVRVAASRACIAQAWCLAGLTDTSGAGWAVVAVHDPAVALQALGAGAADVAVVPAGMPGASGGRFRLLHDGRDVPAAHRPVAVYRQELTWLYPTVADDLAWVSAALDDGTVADLAGRENGPAQAVAAFADADRRGPAVVVAGSPLGALYASQLRAAGYAVAVAEPFPTPAAAVEALADGTVHVVVEPAAALASALPATATGRLQDQLAPIGATAARPAPASPTWVVTTAALADLVGLDDVADLPGPVTGPATVSVAAPRAPTAPTAPPALRPRDDVLTWNDTGPEVTALQHLLSLLGEPVEVTGFYDAPTFDAVRRLQAANGLPADGVAGPGTVARLRELRQAQAGPPPGPPAPGERVVHLSFDDGPDPQWTPAVLDVLARHGARATFFVVGASAAEFPDLTARLAAEGHAVANHTYSHMPLDSVTGEVVAEELGRASMAIEAATDRWPTCVRAPLNRISPAARRGAEAAGYQVVGWDVDTLDWQTRAADAIVDAAVGGAAPGAVVLLHDGGGDRSETVAALPRLLAELGDQGYRFEPVPGC